jgi:hypothetical protein
MGHCMSEVYLTIPSVAADTQMSLEHGDDTGRVTCLRATSLPQMPHGMSWDRDRTFAVRDERPIA